jgi:hypothetical protein
MSTAFLELTDPIVIGIGDTPDGTRTMARAGWGTANPRGGSPAASRQAQPDHQCRLPRTSAGFCSKPVGAHSGARPASRVLPACPCSTGHAGRGRAYRRKLATGTMKREGWQPGNPPARSARPTPSTVAAGVAASNGTRLKSPFGLSSAAALPVPVFCSSLRGRPRPPRPDTTAILPAVKDVSPIKGSTLTAAAAVRSGQPRQANTEGTATTAAGDTVTL